MSVIGYIVQFSDEDEYTVYHGFMRLFRQFSDAREAAGELVVAYLANHHESELGHFEAKTPTKKQCDDQGSVTVFESRGYIVWIDCVIE
jgi:hypothetical protein